MQPELRFDAAHGDGVGRTIVEHIRNEEQAESGICAGQHAVADTRTQIVVAKTDPHLFTADRPTAIVVAQGRCSRPRDIRSCVGLGNADRGRPFTGYQTREPLRLHVIGPVYEYQACG